jgi:glycosyltransferase involved in cell wall biosynthesis
LESRKRVLIIVYSGDFYNAYHRMISGLGELYHRHNYVLKTVSEFAKQDGVEEVAILGCRTKDEYNHYLDIGFRVMGAGPNARDNPSKVNQMIANFRPTHMVLRLPSRSILRWGIRNNVKIITLLADSFYPDSLKTRLNHFYVARLLNHSNVEWVGNHHINSCLSLQKIGVNPGKLIPWDWPSEDLLPEHFSVKYLERDRKIYNFFYAGNVVKTKGVGDLIEALALLREQGLNARLKIAGFCSPETASFEERANTLNIRDSIDFLGQVINEEVIHLMREADIVFVPSHHRYPEGLPLTIYEALCSRTPLIVSDHPMFRGNIEDGHSALVFPEKDPQALAQRVTQLLNDPDLYHRISENSQSAWHQLQIPVDWAGLISRWISDKPENQEWIRTHTLYSGIYDSVNRCKLISNGFN